MENGSAEDQEDNVFILSEHNSFTVKAKANHVGQGSRAIDLRGTHAKQMRRRTFDTNIW